MQILFYLVLGLLTVVRSLQAADEDKPKLLMPAVKTESITPAEREEILNRTLNYAKGHEYFKSVVFQQHEKEFVRLVKDGQSPQTLFIGCSDSRILPDLILSTGPGDLFVLRTAGNFVPAYNPEADDGVSATIQYAVEVLKIRDIIVCGHSHCGAIKGLFDKMDPGELTILRRWLQWGEQAKQITLSAAKEGISQAELYRVTEQVSVIMQLNHLMSYPAVKKLVAENKVDLHGWYYCIETGDIYYYDPTEIRFFPLIGNQNVNLIELKK